jgi:hypothetical protein
MCTNGDVLQITSSEDPKVILREINKYILSKGLKL